MNSSLDNFIDKIKRRINENDNIEKLNKLDNGSLLVLDRYEGIYAICENLSTGEYISISKENICCDAKEGDILKYIDGKLEINYNETKKRKEKIQFLLKDVFDK
ncbi:MAG: DUF3006 domain-containing protein [Clostridiales bacterium]|nr:DUF3006 domain-containing protein [Clostridiales bacterium]